MDKDTMNCSPIRIRDINSHESVKRDSRKRGPVDRRSTVRSPFIKKGEYLKEYSNDAIYDFQNFEFLKLGNELHVIGTGAFGDVCLVKNNKNGRYYAIKQVYSK